MMPVAFLIKLDFTHVEMLNNCWNVCLRACSTGWWVVRLVPSDW